MGKYADQPKQETQKTSKNKGAQRRKRMYMAVMALFLVWAGSTLYSQYIQIQESSEALAQKRLEEKSSLESRDKLSQEVQRLQDPEYVGQIARKKFGLYPPGEMPIIPPKNPGK